MGQELNKVKTRIKSVSGALKVTSAMKLVSTVKLKKWKNKMLAHKDYSMQIEDITKDVLSMCKKNNEFSYSHTKDDKRLFIIVSSTLGLCGAYNSNIFKLADVSLTQNDEAIILGQKGISHFANETFTKHDEFSSYSSINDSAAIRSMLNFIVDGFLKGNYKEVHIIYSEYKNSLVFLAKDSLILPINNPEKEEKYLGYGPILEPKADILVSTLIPIYLKTILYSKLLESEVCEQASRSNAMENATNNANEILDNLKIEFNKARQAAITQEITEIAAAANAL